MADSIEREVLLPTSVQTTWDLITRQDHLCRWVGQDVFLDARLGGRFSEAWIWNRQPLIMRGRVYEFQPASAIAWTWSAATWPVDTFVRLSIASLKPGTLLTASHAGWDAFGEPLRTELREAHGAWWTVHLASLERHAVDLAGKG